MFNYSKFKLFYKNFTIDYLVFKYDYWSFAEKGYFIEQGKQ